MNKSDLNLIYELTIASLKTRYRNTVAGLLWVILNPIITFSVQAFVFKQILKIDMDNYLLFLVSGLLPWIFITSSILMTVGSFVHRSEILKSFNINPFVFIISQVIDNLFNFIISFILIFFVIIFIQPNNIIPEMLYFFLNTFILIWGTSAICLLLTTMNVFFRDLTFILNFLFSVIYFITPIFYPPELIPTDYKWLLKVNILYYFIEPFRLSFIDFNSHVFFASIARASMMAIFLTIASFTYWRKNKNDIIFRV